MKLSRILPLLLLAASTLHAQTADPAALLGTTLQATETLHPPESASVPLTQEQIEAMLTLPSVEGMRQLLGARDIDLTRRGSKEVSIHRRIAPSAVFLQQGEQTCTGSIISPDGKILTCWHCVRGNAQVDVRLHPSIGKKSTGAKLVRADKEKDLALLQIVEPLAGLPVLSLGDAKEIEVGADVFAIGHPFGLNWSFVKGLVSQTYDKRIWQSGATRHEAGVVQAQIDLYLGNSGGPLVSDNGRLIGINASKVEGEKFAFAIALQDIQRFLDQAQALPAQQVVHASPKTGCVPKEMARGRNADNTGTVALFDTNCDGKSDTQLLTLDGAADDLTIATSSDGSGRIDMVRAHKGARVSTYLSGMAKQR